MCLGDLDKGDRGASDENSSVTSGCTATWLGVRRTPAGATARMFAMLM